jgi:formimidoylglutamate deiminase
VPTSLFAERALLPDGWAANVAIEIDATGTIASVNPEAPAAVTGGHGERAGTIVPGMANLHSHAFQRAIAGRGERRSAEHDDFWSWREAMYAAAATIDPENLHRIATHVYRAMRAAGYTAVAEFHYLHRDPRGAWYAQKSRMAEALVRAARDADIAICLLPALYAHGGPRGAPLGAAQARFATAVDDVLEIAADIRTRYAGDPRVTVGVCAHSLRAVTPDEFAALLEGSPRDVPVHLHIAEQEREVDAIRHAYGARPIELLLARFDVTGRFCLVHATHATDVERDGMASSRAVVGLCPTTEANLGDGLFSLAPFLAAGGAFGIGSDSNVSLSPVEELRLLEYGQRLAHRRRIVAATAGRSCGATLYAEAAAHGARACGLRAGIIAEGMRADLVELPPEDASAWAATGDYPGGAARADDPLDYYVFAALRQRPSRVMTAGRWGEELQS